MMGAIETPSLVLARTNLQLIHPPTHTHNSLLAVILMLKAPNNTPLLHTNKQSNRFLPQAAFQVDQAPTDLDMELLHL